VNLQPSYNLYNIYNLGGCASYATLEYLVNGSASHVTPQSLLSGWHPKWVYHLHSVGVGHSLTVHSTLSYMTAVVRYDTRTMEILGSFHYENLVRYSRLSYRIAMVRVLWRTIAQIPGTVRLGCAPHVTLPPLLGACKALAIV
jgi:hypothetical protein